MAPKLGKKAAPQAEASPAKAEGDAAAKQKKVVKKATKKVRISSITIKTTICISTSTNYDLQQKSDPSTKVRTSLRKSSFPRL